MSDFLQLLEIEGLRDDFAELFGDLVDGTGKTSVAIRRTTDSGTLNPTTLQYDAPTVSIIYSGVANFGPIVYRRDRQETAGGEAQRIRQYRMILPWDAGDFHLDDEVEILSSTDPDAVGKKFIVTDVMYESELGARRLTLTDTGLTDDC